MVLSRKSEKNKKGKVMNELTLPDEVVLTWILPLLSMKDVARSSAVSHTWLRYWLQTPILTFEDPSTLHAMAVTSLQDLSTFSQFVYDARSSFITWVNKVLANHIGSTLEEFRLAYYLNKTHQPIIDTWVVWAFSKHVQRLVLDFTVPPITYGSNNEEKHYYVLVLDRTLCNATTKLCLTSLCLKYVNVDTLTLNYILHACASTLEKLCIERSHYLTSIAPAASLLNLKSFMVVNCPHLESIHIHAPNLVSLTYNSGLKSILRVFDIENASKLCYANIIARDEVHFLFVLRSLLKYFSHLEHLRLRWNSNHNMNLVLDKFPVLEKLKHLEILVRQYGRRTLAAWVPFIGACPQLEKLTLEIQGWLLPVARKNVYRDKCPLRCLKTLEIRSFDGVNWDVDIANFVVENCINLKEVILHPYNLVRPLNLEAPFARVDFELPPHAKLVIVQ